MIEWIPQLILVQSYITLVLYAMIYYVIRQQEENKQTKRVQ